MTPHMIAIIDGRYRVYRTPNGIAREYVGPKFDVPRPAHNYAAMLDAVMGISPLRPATRSGPNDSVRGLDLDRQGHSARSGSPDQSPPGLDRG